MKKVLHVVGARPNFVKMAPIWRAIAANGALRQRAVHTGQHYDAAMSEVFFADLEVPEPEIHLGIGSASHAEQTARVMIELEKVFQREQPDLVSVVGDVNSTLAAALVASKMLIPLAHVEAGLRSFDRTMPEEVNRVLTDRVSDVLLTHSADADENLRREGVDPWRIVQVGNVMIDSIRASLGKALATPTLHDLGLTPQGYAVCTLHRPSNVDDPRVLSGLLVALVEISRHLPVVFAVHPRTQKSMKSNGLWAVAEAEPGLKMIDPLGYLAFLALTAQARFVLTDSGGLQEESTALGIHCLTLRENTERPITVSVGTNVLVGIQPHHIVDEAQRVLDGFGKVGHLPERWDGRAAERIAALYEGYLGSRPSPEPTAACL